MTSPQLMEHDAEQPTVYQWNANVQRQVTKDFVVSAGYVGSRGVHLLTNATSNVRTDFQIDDGALWSLRFRDGDGSGEVVRDGDTQAAPGQRAGQHLGEGGVVVDHQQIDRIAHGVVPAATGSCSTASVPPSGWL